MSFNHVVHLGEEGPLASGLELTLYSYLYVARRRNDFQVG